VIDFRFGGQQAQQSGIGSGKSTLTGQWQYCLEVWGRYQQAEADLETERPATPVALFFLIGLQRGRAPATFSCG
jgi:hypothetical protein